MLIRRGTESPLACLGGTIMSLDTEFDLSEGLISPDYEKLDLQLPERAVYAFLSEARIGSYIEIRGGKLIGHLPTTMKNIPIWIVNDDGEDVAVMEASLGAPASVITQERLFAYGVEKMLMISCCGTLVDMPENTFLPVERAYRDEGTSAHYMPASHFIELDPKPLSKIEALFMDLGISVEPCTTWTTDAFFRETRNKVEMRKAQGCQVVNMACSALAACARFRHKEFAEILFTTDTLATVSHDVRTWGREARNAALNLALMAIRRI